MATSSLRALTLALVAVPATLLAQSGASHLEMPVRTSPQALSKTLNVDSSGVSGFSGSGSAGFVPISLGSRSTGRLETSDEMSGFGTYMEGWSLSLRRGQQAVVTMQSTEMPPMLIVFDPVREDFLMSLAPEGSQNASVTFEADRDGDFVILTSSVPAERPGTGAYSLEARPGASRGTVIAYGQAYFGALNPGDARDGNGIYETYHFEGTAGTRVAMSMRMLVEESAMDPTITLLDAAGNVVAENDDGPWGDLNSYIELTLPRTGRYSIVLRDISGEATGDYRVLLTREN